MSDLIPKYTFNGGKTKFLMLPKFSPEEIIADYEELEARILAQYAEFYSNSTQVRFSARVEIHEEDCGAKQVFVDKQEGTVTVLFDDWTLKERKVCIGISSCPDKFQFVEELETEIARNLAEIQYLAYKTRLLRQQRERVDKNDV